MIHGVAPLRSHVLRDLLRLGILAALALAWVFPLAWIASGSLKPLEQIFRLPLEWIPSPVQWNNYPDALVDGHFGRPLLNSVIVTLAQVAINLTFASIAGFGFAKYQFPGKELLFVAVLAMSFLPLQVIMIPLFVVVKTLGWINTYQGLILPTAVSAFGVFLMRQFISSIPNEYMDAARVDGASDLKLFFRIIIPLSTPALVTLGVMVALSSWDEFLWPVIVVSDQDLATAPLAISRLKSLFQFPAHHLLAVAVVLALPPLIAFLVAQRRIIQSISLTGIKG